MNQNCDSLVIIICPPLDLTTSEGGESADGSGLEGAARALSNLGSAHEALGQADEAVRFYERHLGAANQLDDPAARTQAYENLGRLQHGRGNLGGAVEYLERGLAVAEQTGRREEEARLRHRLGK